MSTITVRRKSSVGLDVPARPVLADMEGCISQLVARPVPPDNPTSVLANPTGSA